MHDMTMYEDDVLYTMMHTPFEDDVDSSIYTIHAIEDDIYTELDSDLIMMYIYSEMYKYLCICTVHTEVLVPFHNIHTASRG